MASVDGLHRGKSLIMMTKGVRVVARVKVSIDCVSTRVWAASGPDLGHVLFCLVPQGCGWGTG